MKTNNIGRTETMRIGKFIITITARLNDECKNGHEDFGLTYSLWEEKNGRKYDIGGGCAAGSTDQIVRKAIRKFGLEPVERVHLSDMNGVPMFPTANAIYHAKNSGFEVFRDYLRLTDEEAKQAFYIDDELGLYVWLLDNGIIDRWKNEANEAIKAIINGRDIEFESTATKKQGHWYFKVEPTKERLDGQRYLIQTGYYDCENYDQHRQEENMQEVRKKLSTEYYEKQIEKAKAKIRLNKAFLAMLEEHLAEFSDPVTVADNWIFYDHRSEIVFNWNTGFGRNQVSENDFQTVKKYFAYAEENNICLTLKK